MGSWNTMEISLPLIFIISFSLFLLMSSPRKRILSDSTTPGGSISLRMEKLLTDLPLPDSPTIPSTCPSSKEKLTPSTALTTPRKVWK